MRRADIERERKERLKKPDEYFTGRGKELASFHKRLKSPPEKPVWYLHAPGGKGKSEVLKAFRQECRKVSLPCALVDFGADSTKTEAGLLYEIASELGLDDLPAFRKCYERYDRLTRALATRTDVITETAEEVSHVASLSSAGAITEPARKRLDAWLRRKDVEFLGQSSEILFDAFVKDTGNYIGDGQRQAPVVLLFDTFEQASAVQKGILDDLIFACRPLFDKISFVVVGRDNLKQTPNEEQPVWQQDGYMEADSLDDLPEEEAKKYLENRKITHPELVRRILTLTGGFPMFLKMAVEVVEKTPVNHEEIAESFPEKNMDEKKVAEYLVKRILDRLPEDQAHLKDVIRRLGIPRWFDLQTFAYLIDKTAEEAASDWNTITGTSLVELAETGRYKFHDCIRDAILSFWRDVPDEQVKYHRMLAGYHDKKTDDLGHLRELLYHRSAFEPLETITVWSRFCDISLSTIQIGLYEALLSDAAVYPIAWSELEGEAFGEVYSRIGIAYSKFPTKRTSTVQKAIECYEAALRIYTEEDFPQQWAMTQNNSAVAYSDLPTGDRGENLQKAIGCYQSALRVYTEKGFPQDWAMTQNNLGRAYVKRTLKVKESEDLNRARECFANAVRGYRSVGDVSSADEAESMLAKVEEILSQK